MVANRYEFGDAKNETVVTKFQKWKMGGRKGSRVGRPALT